MRNDNRLRAGDDGNAVVASQRIGHHRRGEVFLHSQRLAIDRERILRRPSALRDRHMAVVGLLKSVFVHLPCGHQRIDAVRAAVAERREMFARRDVVIRGDLGVTAEPGGIARHNQDRRGRTGLDPAQRVAEHVHGRRAAVGVLQQPAQRQAETPGEIDGGIGRQRERRHRHALDFAGIDLRVLQCCNDRVADESVRRLSWLRTPNIGRLADADDGSIHGHRNSGWLSFTANKVVVDTTSR